MLFTGQEILKDLEERKRKQDEKEQRRKEKLNKKRKHRTCMLKLPILNYIW